MRGHVDKCVITAWLSLSRVTNYSVRLRSLPGFKVECALNSPNGWLLHCMRTYCFQHMHTRWARWRGEAIKHFWNINVRENVIDLLIVQFTYITKWTYQCARSIFNTILSYFIMLEWQIEVFNLLYDLSFLL